VGKIINALNDQRLQQFAKQVGLTLVDHGLMLVSAESCTGGWLGQIITSVAGSSAWYEQGFITYTDMAKQETLGISSGTLEQYGAVSEQTALEMARGAISRSHAQMGVAVTGIAGPDGGSVKKPVGMVCFSWALKDGHMRNETRYFTGNREMIRRQTVVVALQGVIALLHSGQPLPAAG